MSKGLRRYWVGLGAASVVLCASALAAAAPPPAATLAGTGDAVTLPNTQAFTMRSRAGKDYRILVSVPPGEPPAGGFGVLTVLDGNAYFGVAAQAMGLLQAFPLIPEKGELLPAVPTLVVGIGYPGDQAIDGERRSWDFMPPARTPAATERLRGPSPGGADAFIDFLVQELRPALAARYRIDPARHTLAGHSLGGYFALHTLAHQPDAFQRYVAISPAVWWDDSRILGDLGQADLGGTQVMLTMAEHEWPGFPDGSAEMLNGARAVRDVLVQRGLTGDALRYAESPLDDHMTTPFAVMPAATRFAAMP